MPLINWWTLKWNDNIIKAYFNDWTAALTNAIACLLWEWLYYYEINILQLHPAGTEQPGLL